VKCILVATVLVALLGPACAEAAGIGPLGCTFQGTINGQPNTWDVVFPGFLQYGANVIGSTMVGFNVTTNAGLHGSVYLKGGFPAYLT
jgi:hypothetical protein